MNGAIAIPGVTAVRQSGRGVSSHDHASCQMELRAVARRLNSTSVPQQKRRRGISTGPQRRREVFLGPVRAKSQVMSGTHRRGEQIGPSLAKAPSHVADALKASTLRCAYHLRCRGDHDQRER